MNRYELLAFVITPLTVAALGWLAVLWTEHSERGPKPPSNKAR